MWLGKLIAGAIGFATAGLPGLVIGVLVGHFFDKGFANIARPLSAEQRRRIEAQFFRTVFTLLGRLAKADGRISEQEVALTEQVIARMGLHTEHRQEAIALFKEGAQPNFSVDGEMDRFRQVCGRQPALSRMLLNYLLSLAIADGVIDRDEEQLLRQVAQRLGLSPRMFEQLMRMVRAQTHFKGFQDRTPPDSQSELATAYEALGVSQDATDTEVKRAYRKLMSENHPDKLMGRGVPDDMIELATERSQEIQTAYDLIKKHRADGGRT